MPGHSNRYVIGRISVSPQHNVLSKGEVNVQLQPKVMAVLNYLASHSERVISNEELLDNVWEGRVVTHSSIQKSINSLRTAIAELDPENEYVAHFSKRGYQLVIPVQNSKQAPPKPVSRRYPWASWGAKLGLLAIVVIGGFLFLEYGKGRVDGAMDSSEDPTTTVSIWHRPLMRADLLIPDTANERDPEPHIGSGRMAYIKDGLTLHSSSQLMVNNGRAPEWSASQARGRFIDLAWSPSGRNLVAVDEHRDEEGEPAPSYFEAQAHYYTFHIFTLDFKGEKVVEKNVLSHWQGRVQSVNWWDENTLEFVASQGTRAKLERYRYTIATQKLQLVEAPQSLGEPVVSRVNQLQTAVIYRSGTGHTQVVHFNEEQQIENQWAVSALRDVSWLPAGDGVLLLAEGGNVSVADLTGSVQSVVLPTSNLGRLERVRAFSMSGSLLASQAKPQANLSWYNEVGQSRVFSADSAKILGAWLHARSNGLVFGLQQDGHFSLHRIARQKSMELFRTPLAHRPFHLQMNPEGDSVLYGHNGQVWAYQFASGMATQVATDLHQFAPLSFQPASKRLWGLISARGSRNLWQIDSASQEKQQLTFGSVATALATVDAVFFQYQSQPGLWRVDKKSSEVTKVSQQVPANVRIISVSETALYYSVGGYCRESGLYALDFSSNATKLITKNDSQTIQTLDYHADKGRLLSQCEPDHQDIIKIYN